MELGGPSWSQALCLSPSWAASSVGGAPPLHGRARRRAFPSRRKRRSEAGDGGLQPPVQPAQHSRRDSAASVAWSLWSLPESPSCPRRHCALPGHSLAEIGRGPAERGVAASVLDVRRAPWRASAHGLSFARCRSPEEGIDGSRLTQSVITAEQMMSDSSNGLSELLQLESDRSWPEAWARVVPAFLAGPP